ncbi:MAG: hypothetical protein RL095_4181 [Verrucomicrobiota bacterium]|jgi:y4mF family transcriptional regulator
MQDFIDRVASEVRRHRKLAGLTQLELARLAGVGKTMVFDLEAGKATVRWANLLKVMAVLGMEFELRSRLGAEP